MLTFNQIMTELKKKKFRPIYLLMGEETFFIEKISKFLEENILPENQRSFNQLVLYGKDTDVATVINTARRFPMMAKYLVVFLKEAQNLKNIDKLSVYAEHNPPKSTILIIEHKYKSVDKRKKLIKAIEQAGGAVFEAKKLYENQVPKWINEYVQNSGLKIEPQATLLLVEYLGNDLSKIANEIDKLALVLKKGDTITKKLINENIGISKDFTVFELQKALGMRNILKANRIADHFAKNLKSNPFVLTVSSLYYYFSKVLLTHYHKNAPQNELAKILKIHPFFVNEYKTAARNYSPKKLMQIISYLREYDLRSKGVNNASTPDGELLKELVFKILH